MKRIPYLQLLKWKESEGRKPLILNGARQIGKTWLLKEFGQNEFEHLAYVSCDSAPLAETLFTDYDVERIIRTVETIAQVPVVAGKTLIVFDEIQELPRGLGALKYFCENAPEYHVAVAGSLLGIALHQGTSFPVGKVDMLDIYPMTFMEFLWAVGEEALANVLETKDWPVVETLHPKYVELLRQYYYVGGMPEAVLAYSTGKTLKSVRNIQQRILKAYQADISKHAPKRDVQRVNMVLNSIPSQLAKENKKFVYGAIKKGARAAEFELAIQWLVDTGIVHKVHRVTKPGNPLKFYEDPNAFKLFLLDCGLFGAMSGADAAHVLLGDNCFTEYKGAFTEQFVMQHLATVVGLPVFYYSSDTQLEIDFLIQYDGVVAPVEVKAEENLRSKSLKVFSERFDLKKKYRISMRHFEERDGLTDIPLYAVPVYFKSEEDEIV